MTTALQIGLVLFAFAIGGVLTNGQARARLIRNLLNPWYWMPGIIVAVCILFAAALGVASNPALFQQYIHRQITPTEWIFTHYFGLRGDA